VSAAKGVLTRVERELDRCDSDGDWNLAPQALVDRWYAARDRLDTAEARLDAVLSQQPARGMGAWGRLDSDEGPNHPAGKAGLA
jgi:hypothetical protein